LKIASYQSERTFVRRRGPKLPQPSFYLGERNIHPHSPTRAAREKNIIHLQQTKFNEPVAMKIDPYQTVCGRSVRAIRDFLLSVTGCMFTRKAVIDRFNCDLTEHLLAEGLIEISYSMINGDGNHYYCLTFAGQRLASARLNKRLRRPTAEKILAAFLERVDAANANPDLLLRVSDVYVFGSYLTDEPSLGDIDIAIRFERKSFPGRDWVELNFERARQSGRCLTFLQRLYYGDDEFIKLLRNRSAYLSLHSYDELKRLGCAHRRIFPPPPSREVSSQRCASRPRRSMATPSRRRRRGRGADAQSRG
ncbi:nucleotidyltransferase domain-containing protein, partial [Xanthobacteraceae bacterium Astr-EGSB]|uniref:hypothetical protein n=1 Tax=Astrobacterium formosum TaxID=3069710 RepID=UPI0027AFE25C|nr:nucleotidyltransferase domain-containing protein [Xanthobacteraceae bacterium Astr-EGSB]